MADSSSAFVLYFPLLAAATAASRAVPPLLVQHAHVSLQDFLRGAAALPRQIAIVDIALRVGRCTRSAAPDRAGKTLQPAPPRIVNAMHKLRRALNGVQRHSCIIHVGDIRRHDRMGHLMGNRAIQEPRRRKNRLSVDIRLGLDEILVLVHIDVELQRIRNPVRLRE